MKIAVLGLGFMGSTHLKAWRQIPEAQLAAVASNNKLRLSGDLTGVAGRWKIQPERDLVRTHVHAA